MSRITGSYGKPPLFVGPGLPSTNVAIVNGAALDAIIGKPSLGVNTATFCFCDGAASTTNAMCTGTFRFTALKLSVLDDATVVLPAANLRAVFCQYSGEFGTPLL